MTPNTWRLTLADLADAAVTPPRGFAGVMELNVELLLADGSVADRKGLRLEWLSSNSTAKAPPRQHDAAEIAQIVKKGDELKGNGDVAAARLMYQRAAEAGDAAAAFALAETYDPLVLARGGIAPDVGLAQTWYWKARELGSVQALERLDRLTRSPEQ
jgi:TPR repeat protein